MINKWHSCVNNLNVFNRWIGNVIINCVIHRIVFHKSSYTDKVKYSWTISAVAVFIINFCTNIMWLAIYSFWCNGQYQYWSLMYVRLSYFGVRLSNHYINLFKQFLPDYIPNLLMYSWFPHFHCVYLVKNTRLYVVVFLSSNWYISQLTLCW